jgi:hypothetical protein
MYTGYTKTISLIIKNFLKASIYNWLGRLKEIGNLSLLTKLKYNSFVTSTRLSERPS